MAELKKIPFLLFISLVILPAHALDVILSGAHQDFKQKSEIIIDIINGGKIYRETLNQLTYEAELGISKVIVYIISRSRCIEILRPAGVARETRSQIAQELREMHCELVFLGIENVDDDEYHLIAAFMVDKIRRHPKQPYFTIETIGENRFDQFYRCFVWNFEKFQENAQICRETLLARLRSIPHGALRPIGCNNKEIKLFGYYPVAKEVRWNVNIVDYKYVPDVDLGDPKYNFKIKYPNRKICLLILSGKDYSDVTRYGKRSLERAQMNKILDGMTKINEVLIIFGVFNFDWTEVDIVTQIILKHSEAWQSSVDNVFVCGYGMFNTFYLYDCGGARKYIRQQPNSYVSEVINILMGEEVKERAINVYYFDDKWKSANIPIYLGSGRYIPELRFNNFTVPCLYQKIAFIVYDQTEMYDPIDYLAVGQSLGELERSGISVVLVETFNFGLYDMHIIAEWIDRHSGVINSEQIAVLGGGIFDSIFQSESTTYNRFLDTKKTELITIRNACVRSGNAKSVSATNIDYHNFEIWSYPMHTVVNGFYEPDLIPDKNMFDTTDGRRILFIITSAHNFQQIPTTVENLDLVMSFRQNINRSYPDCKWSVFLVGLDNFEERDYHLFAELVKSQTNDGRSFEKFVRATNYGISPAIVYQYKDGAPFGIDYPHSITQPHISYFFEWTRILSQNTRFH